MKATLAQLRAPVTISASAAPEDGKPAGPPTFQALAYSGGPVPGYTLSTPIKGDYIIDLAGMTPAKKMRANLDHKPNQRVGHLTGYTNDGKQVQVSGVLSAATPHRDEVAGSAAAGYEWEVSTEANLSNLKTLGAGKKAVVNGREVVGPLTIFQKSVFTALGFVSTGADEGNQVTIAASAAGAFPNSTGATMNEFEKFAASLGIDLAVASDEQKANLRKLFDAQAGSGGAGKTFATIAAEERAEFGRQEAIKKMALTAIRENPFYADAIERAVDQAIEAKLTADEFELKLLRETRPKAGDISTRLTGRGQDPRVLECALSIFSGLPDVEKHYPEPVLDAVDRNHMRGFSIQQLLMTVAAMNGYSCRAGEHITVGNIRSVLEYCFPPAMARLAGFSTVSLPTILGNVANKNILAGYMESDQTWREFARVKPTTNFYQQSHYRMLDNLEYEEVGSGGELHHGTIAEEGYTSQAKTYGKLLGLTRQQIINDDGGAFGDIRERLGRGAAKKFGNVFWPTYPQLDLSCAA